MGRNIEDDYSRIFSIANQLKSGQNPLTPLQKEKLETLLKDGGELAGYYDLWKNAKFWLGSKDKEELRQGYLGKVEEFRRLKESYMGIAPKEEGTSPQTKEQSLEAGLRTEQTQRKGPFILCVVYTGNKKESELAVQDRKTLIKLFQKMNPPFITEKYILYLEKGEYRKATNPNQLPKDA